MAPRQKGKAQGLRGTRYIDGDNLRVVKMPGALRDWQIECVCGGTHKTCNNGWMRSIEDQARPLMIPLILGQHTRLSAAQQQKIATWIALKAMVSEYDAGDFVTTHHTQRKRMMRVQLPPVQGWGIWIGNYTRELWRPEWMSIPFLVVPKPREGQDLNLPPTHYNGHSSTQVINKLFIQVIRLPMADFVEGWRFPVPDGGGLFRIWPPTQFSIKWPPKPLTDREADLIASAIEQRFLAIAKNRRGS